MELKSEVETLQDVAKKGEAIPEEVKKIEEQSRQIVKYLESVFASMWPKFKSSHRGWSAKDSSREFFVRGVRFGVNQILNEQKAIDEEKEKRENAEKSES